MVHRKYMHIIRPNDKSEVTMKEVISAIFSDVYNRLLFLWAGIGSMSKLVYEAIGDIIGVITMLVAVVGAISTLYFKIKKERIELDRKREKLHREQILTEHMIEDHRANK